MSTTSGQLTWRCEVCGIERPDDKISVHKHGYTIKTVPVTRNVRYCNDSDFCITNAADRKNWLFGTRDVSLVVGTPDAEIFRKQRPLSRGPTYDQVLEAARPIFDAYDRLLSTVSNENPKRFWKAFQKAVKELFGKG